MRKNANFPFSSPTATAAALTARETHSDDIHSDVRLCIGFYE